MLTDGETHHGLGVVLGLVATVGVGVLLLIMMSTFSGQTVRITEPIVDNMLITKTGYNFTVTLSNVSTRSLGNLHVINGTLTLRNRTSSPGSLVNFTINYVNGSIKVAAGALKGYMFNGKAYNASYQWKNYSIKSQVQNTQLGGLDAQRQTGTFMPIIVLAAVFALIFAFIKAGDFGSGGGASL